MVAKVAEAKILVMWVGEVLQKLMAADKWVACHTTIFMQSAVPLGEKPYFCLPAGNISWYKSCFVLQEERVLRNNKNYQTLDTNKSGVRFHSPALADLNSEYLRARSRYAEQQKAIVTEIVNIAGEDHAVPLVMWILKLHPCNLFQFLCVHS